ncbi:hypothetical protein F5880DRAFT_1733871 [Lentinula raphanica]|nr:hypothetical protein F5880DRAFT_1733871 [Lentinula raphanica]
MSLQVHSSSAKSWILGIVLIATLTFTLGGSTVDASPLPPGIPPGRESSGPIVALDIHGSVSTMRREFNSTILALSPRQLPEKGSISQQPAGEDVNSPGFAEVMKNSLKLFKNFPLTADRRTKILDKASMLVEYTFIGYTYADPRVAKNREGAMINVQLLSLPNRDKNLLSGGKYGIYDLLPKVWPEQNPKDERGEQLWTCTVYAKSSKIPEKTNKKKQETGQIGKETNKNSQKNDKGKQVETDTIGQETDETIEQMRSMMEYNVAEQYSAEDPTERLPLYSQVPPEPTPGSILFFQNPFTPVTRDIVVMRLPKVKKYIDAWDLLAWCYESPDGLTMNAPWEDWRRSIKNLPEDVKLIPTHRKN